VASSLAVSYDADWDALGAGLSDLLELDEAEAAVLGWMTRDGGVRFEQIVAHVGGDRAGAREVLESFLERGLVSESDAAGPGDLRYDVRLAVRRGRRLPGEVWDALAGGDGANAAEPGEPGEPGDVHGGGGDRG